MENTLKVANWFLRKEPMTHKKLQKLCYYAQGWSYALQNGPLMDDSFEAWIHGPVSPKLYQHFKDHYWEQINPEKNVDTTIESQEDLNVLESVYYTYGDMSANALEALTRSEMPWTNAREGYDERDKCEVLIDPEDMKSYYQSIYAGEGD